ncbi:MAG: hypothetical protein ACM3WU_05740 [Bacillota bacterium]
MSLTEMLGAEDNPFGLFLILILLLGATGYFDPAPKAGDMDVEAASGAALPPVATLPVWQRRPAERQLVRPFSGERPSRRAPKKDLLTAVFEMLGLPKPKKAFALLRKALTARQSRHPLLHLRHKMLQ